MKIEITARKRDTKGTGSSRRMRTAGRVPGILYGGDRDAVNIELDHKELHRHLQKEAFHASILTLKLDSAEEPVLLRAYNMHPFKAQVQHVDFQRVSKDRKIHMKVPLHFANGETSPAVKVSGAIVSHVITEIDISCLPKDLPEFITVDLSTLDVGHSVHVSALQLPAGVTVVTKGKLDPVVAAAVVPKAQVEETAEVTPEAEAAAAAAGAAGTGAPGAAPAADAKAGDAKGGDKKESGGKDDKKK